MPLANGNKIWFVGDSKTKGEIGNTAYTKSYRHRTVARLASMGLTLTPVGTYTDTAGVKHSGVNSTTLTQHLAEIQGKFSTHAPDLIVLDGGTNDAGSPGGYSSGDTIVTRIATIVDWVLAQNATVRILVNRQPLVFTPGSATQTGALRRAAQLLPAMIASKDQARTRWFDSTILRRSDLFDDVHPDDGGADRQAHMAADQIQRWSATGWLGAWSTDFDIPPTVGGAISSGADW
jgi:lysophospholipase L1-like esterase